MSNEVALRPYQRDAVAAVLQDWRDHTDVLGTAATGTGKTILFLDLLAQVLKQHPGRRAMIIAHRKELIEQPIERMQQFWPEMAMRSGIVMADQDECDKQVIVATVQTLASDRRLDRVLAFGNIDYLITDESHHSGASSYQALYKRLRSANPEMRHLGVTATPMRSDGHGMVETYQKESFHLDIRTMVKGGWLVPPRWLAIQTGISLAGVAVSHGDFQGKQLADVYETDNCFDLVVESHSKYADGRQALAFVESVNGAYRLAEKFREGGLRAEAADGGTKKERRADILKRFRKGELDVLVNVGLYTEGLDVPQVSCIHQVRPTKSDGLYVQIIGRALRTAPGKDSALILDYCPVEARNICMLGDVLGVDMRKDAYIKDDQEVGAVIAGFTFDGNVKWLLGDPAEIISRELDYMELSPFSWHRGDGWLTLGLGEASDGKERTLAISPVDADGFVRLYIVARARYNRSGSTTEIVQRGTFEVVSEEAQRWIEKYGNIALVSKERDWRKQAASDAQRSFATALKVWRQGMSKGECAQAITHSLAVREARKVAGGQDWA
jgi:superfamily II DNA or RNA helicase